MMPQKSPLNPNAAPFVPLPENLPEMRHEEHDKASKKTSEISDSSGDAGKAESFKLSGSASVQNIKNIQGQVSEEISSKEGQFDFSDEANYIMNDLDTLSTMLPDYSRDSLTWMYNANQGDLMETVYALGQLECDDDGDGDGDAFEDFPQTSEAIDNSVAGSSTRSESERGRPEEGECSPRG